MTNEDIAKAGGLSRAAVAKISQLDSWDTVSLRMIDAFARGCGVDLLRPSRRREKRLFARGKFAMFQNSSASQRRMYARILARIKAFEEGQHDNRGPQVCSNQ